MQLGSSGVGLLFLMVLVACGQPAAPAITSGGGQPSTTAAPDGAPRTHGGPVTDQASLLAHLQGKGLTVEVAGDVQQPFFNAQGTLVHINGGTLTQPADVQVFEYETAEVATADVQQIGPDGSPRTMMITWVAPPHFFHSERVVVLYTGNDPALLTLLTEALGPQFAGA